MPLVRVAHLAFVVGGPQITSSIFQEFLRASGRSGPQLCPQHGGSHKVMAASLECINFEEEQLPDKRETMNWKPRKVKPIILGQTKADECLRKNIPRILDSDSEESEFSAISPYEDDVSRSPVGYYVQPDLEDLDGEISNMLENVTSPEQQTALVYEVEDWDKELEDSESNPYDAGDLYCGSFQENNLLVSYSLQEESLYNPCCHHAASLAFTLPVRVTEIGQFDDADE
ncbi:coordinator of PRMT5 and differentiation stimulator isoform X1 [Anser cygnoides]|uniref:coordinator of PRMT5 and differentiation stimulator isoform X1 n=2 Tax=Anser cygnoides TaxID=8845 RepID=UPI002009D098|nr:coordinator of PRMT5 and differentiation stimulator isoform X2 [Anser cygnoides]